MAMFAEGVAQLRIAVNYRLDGLEGADARLTAADIEAVRVAAMVGDERSVEICLRLPKSRAVTPVTQRMTLDESRFREHAIPTVREHGGRRHRRVLAEWLRREGECRHDPDGSSR